MKSLPRTRPGSNPAGPAHRPRCRGRTSAPRPSSADCILRVVNRAGSAKELDLDPCDQDRAHKRAERIAALVAALVEPKVARGGSVVVILVTTGEEVERVPIRVKRRNKPAAPAPTPRRKPLSRKAAEKSRLARYEILVESALNRLGHTIVDKTYELLDLLEQFEDAKEEGGVGGAFLDAGVTLEEEDDRMWAGYFGFALEDAAGFAWSLAMFRSVFECDLVRRPADMGEGVGS